MKRLILLYGIKTIRLLSKVRNWGKINDIVTGQDADISVQATTDISLGSKLVIAF